MARPKRYGKLLNINVEDAAYEALSRVANARHKQTGSKPLLADLWREAIRLGLQALEKQHEAPKEPVVPSSPSRPSNPPPKAKRPVPPKSRAKAPGSSSAGSQKPAEPAPPKERKPRLKSWFMSLGTRRKDKRVVVVVEASKAKAAKLVRSSVREFDLTWSESTANSAWTAAVELGVGIWEIPNSVSLVTPSKFKPANLWPQASSKTKRKR